MHMTKQQKNPANNRQTSTPVIYLEQYNVHKGEKNSGAHVLLIGKAQTTFTTIY